MRPQSHTRATLKPGECGPTARRRGCAKAATLKGRAELSAKLALRAAKGQDQCIGIRRRAPAPIVCGDRLRPKEIINRQLSRLPVLLAFGLTALPPTLAAQAQPVVPARIDARMMRQPAVSVTQIAF